MKLAPLQEGLSLRDAVVRTLVEGLLHSLLTLQSETGY